MTHRLITIRFSHYCEKARWALDRAAVPYVEESHVPILSWLATFGVGAKRTVPALVTETGTLSDSTDILHWVDKQSGATPLFLNSSKEVEAEIAAWENDFDLHLGPAARRITYFMMMGERKRVRSLMMSAGTPWEQSATKLLFPIIFAAMVRGLGIHQPGFERSLEVVRQTFSRVEAKLRDGRQFLAGDQFSAADLTFASLAYPLVWPDQVVKFVGTLDVMPDFFRSTVAEFRAALAGQFALKMYAEQR